MLLVTEDNTSKAIIDKADVASIVTPVTGKDLEVIQHYADQIGIAPTHVMDIYKIRSGRFRGVRIWYYFNLGNGVRKDLFITDSENNFLNFEPYELIEKLSVGAKKLSLFEMGQILSEKSDEF